MHIDETTSPDSPTRPAETQPAPANMPLGRALDKSVDSQRRRLLAIAIPNGRTREATALADEALEQLSLTFFSAPDAALGNAFAAALDAVTRPTKSVLVDHTSKHFDGAIVAAAFDGQRLVISAADPGSIIVQQGDRRFAFPHQKDAGDEFLDLAATIFETKLDPGDIVALLSNVVVQTDDDSKRLTRDDVAEITGPQGIWLWIELDKPKRQDLRHRAGLLSTPEPEIQRISSTTAKPADPLWDPTSRMNGAFYQKPPAVDSLRRYRGSSNNTLGRGIRTRLPRGRPSVLLTGSALFVLLLAGGLLAFLYSSRPAPAPAPDPEIASYTASLATALSSNDPAKIENALPSAQQALALGEKLKTPEDELAVLRNEIVQAQDILAGVLRMDNFTLIGQLPELPDDTPVRLGESAGVLYLLSPGPYQLDAGNLTLLGLPFSPTSPIRSFDAHVTASDAAGVISSDGSRLVQMGFDGNAVELGVTVWPPGAKPVEQMVAGYQNRLYLLDEASGEIWVADGKENQAYRWLADSEPPLKPGAVGMVINGAIHVVYPDGRVLNMNAGETYQRLDLNTWAEEFEVLAIDVGDTTGDLYTITRADDVTTLEVIDLNTGEDTEVLLPLDLIGDKSAEMLLDTVDSFVVSEARGTIYWIADGSLWSATLPKLPSAEQQAE